MDLLSLLGNVMGNDDSLNALSETTGTTKEESASLLTNALPVLVGKLTENSSTQEGAQSLFNALGAHKDEGSVSDLILNADKEDGGKIVGHILGSDSTQVIESLSNQTGVSQEKVSDSLSSIAPILLSILSSAVGSGGNNNQSGGGIDLGNVLSLFGGNSNSGSGIDFGSILGGLTQSQPQVQQVEEPQQSSGGILSFLGGLFGKKQEQAAQQVQVAQQVQQQVQTVGNSGQDGTQLLSILTSLLK